MHINQKLALILTGSALSCVLPAEAVLSGTIRTAGRFSGLIIGYEAFTKREETKQSWNRLSTTVREIHKKHAHTDMGSSHPVCDQLAATVKEIATELHTHLQEKSIEKAASEISSPENSATQPVEQKPSVGKIIYEDGSFLTIQALKTVGAYRLIKGK